ncbi:hypothetical protein C7212DRAFT_335528 [Tuber magnatum]|uniref:Secreted protein n=1 Tax=Tuber magnatum TaxID=42249 RepID=A0A317SEY8_9PEZI|nr:hypothetical protein C7212DRAFT_335528 [Tuber magnatum]
MIPLFSILFPPILFFSCSLSSFPSQLSFLNPCNRCYLFAKPALLRTILIPSPLSISYPITGSYVTNFQSPLYIS